MDLYQQHTCDTILLEQDCLTNQEISQEFLADWENSGLIFSISFEKEKAYPTYQFDNKRQPLPIMKDILKVLREVTQNNWNIASWFHHANG